MARTLFFLEALVFAAMAAIIPVISADFAAYLIAPLAVALLLPLAASIATRPFAELRRALACAFSGRRPRGPKGQASAVLAELGGYARIAAAVGFLLACAGALTKPDPGTGYAAAPRSGAFGWAFFGVYLCLYGALEALVLRSIGRAARSLQEAPANADLGDGTAAILARRFGLTPREWETAAAIASGSSYKETAGLLGISVATVKAHIASVYRKTGSRDKIELVLLLRREKGEGGPNTTNG